MIAERYPGQNYFRTNNANIRATEERWEKKCMKTINVADYSRRKEIAIGAIDELLGDRTSGVFDIDGPRGIRVVEGLHRFQQVLLRENKELEDKAMIAAVMILSTQHDPNREELSFSHLTMEQCFDKLVARYEEIRGSVP